MSEKRDEKKMNKNATKTNKTKKRKHKYVSAY